MSTEYYLVCPALKRVLELYKEHQYLKTLNSIERSGGYENFLQTIYEERDFVGINEHQSPTILTKVIGFLKDCSGHEVFHFNDNQWIDWFNENYADDFEIGVPGMSKTTPDGWIVYEW